MAWQGRARRLVAVPGGDRVTVTARSSVNACVDRIALATPFTVPLEALEHVDLLLGESLGVVLF
jgi:hypothetical protein